jgi:hypothetical protein
MEPTYLDLETAALDHVAEFYDDAEAIVPPANYVNPDVIAAYLARETVRRQQAFIEKAALDPDLCRIVYLGVWHSGQTMVCLWPCKTASEEAEQLAAFWDGYQPGEVFCGFNIRAFDLAVLCRRSLYLGVPTKPLERDRYRSPCVLDLFEILNEGRKRQRHSLDWYCTRFGISCEIKDTITGAEVPGCVARGEWDKVRAHLLADLIKVRRLAQRIGVAPRRVAA